MLHTGRLNEHPLTKLIETCRSERETGLLEVWTSTDSGSFYFKDGELVNAGIGKLTGAKAVEFAGELTDAAFSFRSLQPAEFIRRVWELNFGDSDDEDDTTQDNGAKVTTLALGQLRSCISAFNGMLKKTAAVATAVKPQVAPDPPKVAPDPPKAPPSSQGVADNGTSAAEKSRQAVKRAKANQAIKRKLTPPKTNFKQAVMTIGGAVVAVSVVVFSVIQFVEAYRIFTNPRPAAAADIKDDVPQGLVHGYSFKTSRGKAGSSASARKGATSSGDPRPDKESSNHGGRAEGRKGNNGSEISSSTVSQTPAPRSASSDAGVSDEQPVGSRAHSVGVALSIENGRVTRASITNHRHGMEAYEESALRIARQRRYPPDTRREETITIRVNKPTEGTQP